MVSPETSCPWHRTTSHVLRTFNFESKVARSCLVGHQTLRPRNRIKCQCRVRMSLSYKANHADSKIAKLSTGAGCRVLHISLLRHGFIRAKREPLSLISPIRTVISTEADRAFASSVAEKPASLPIPPPSKSICSCSSQLSLQNPTLLQNRHQVLMCQIKHNLQPVLRAMHDKRRP